MRAAAAEAEALDGHDNTSAMPGSTRWAIATGLFAIAAAYSLLNVIAGANFGYDDYPGGKEIVNRWAFGFLALAALTLGCAVAAGHTRRRQLSAR